MHLEKLRILFYDKWHSFPSGFTKLCPCPVEYFKNLGCDVKIGSPFEEDEEHINISVPKLYTWKPDWQIKIPVELAERVLVLGFP